MAILNLDTTVGLYPGKTRDGIMRKDSKAAKPIDNGKARNREI